MKDDWIVLKGQAFDDLKTYLLAHEEVVGLEVLFVTVMGRMPGKYCSHEESYVEMEEALQRNHGGKATGLCSCGARVTVHYSSDTQTFSRGPT